MNFTEYPRVFMPANTGTATGKLGKFGRAFNAVGSGIAGAGAGYLAGEGINAATGHEDASVSRDLAMLGGFSATGASYAGPIGAAVGAAVGAVGAIIDQGHELYARTDGFTDFGGKIAKFVPEEREKLSPAPFRADRYNPSQRSPELQEQKPVINSTELSHGFASALVGRTLRVEVVNTVRTSGGDGPRVDPNGRLPTPGPWRQ